MLALPLREVSVKARTGGVVDDEPRTSRLPHWAGVRAAAARARPAASPTPASPCRCPTTCARPRSPWLTAAPMRGEHVILEPLDMSHVDELFAATADAEVWRHLGSRRSRATATRWPRSSPRRCARSHAR